MWHQHTLLQGGHTSSVPHTGLPLLTALVTCVFWLAHSFLSYLFHPRELYLYSDATFLRKALQNPLLKMATHSPTRFSVPPFAASFLPYHSSPFACLSSPRIWNCFWICFCSQTYPQQLQQCFKHSRRFVSIC